MYIGAQLMAPHGFNNLQKERIYHFLRSQEGGVALVSFHEYVSKKKKRCGKDGKYLAVARTYRALIHRMVRGDFEQGLLSEQIQIQEDPHRLPPWLATTKTAHAGLEAIDTDVKHSERIDSRLEAIAGLLSRKLEIIESADPVRIINEHARAIKKNESRINLWFWTYLLYGTRESLHYPTGNLGKWDRNNHGKKRGRKTLDGGSPGYNVTDDRAEKLLEGYEECRKEGQPLSLIYADVLRVSFGCKTRNEGIGGETVYHPDGEWFPTYDQFLYHVKKRLGEKAVAEDKHGGKKVSETMSYSGGRVVEGISNLFERTESDAYACSDRPKSYISHTVLPALRVCVEIDVASAEKVGIGFSLNAETGAQYRAAQFCSAIPKSVFGRIIGMEIRDEDWPAIGVSPKGLLDRGPGSGKSGFAESPGSSGVTLARTQRPRDKATVESSHPKNIDLGHGPAYRTSGKSVAELMRVEVDRLIKHNKSANVFGHVPPSLVKELPVATPNTLYKTLDRRGRSQAHQMSFANAVRTYLPTAEAQIRDDGLYVFDQRYWSAEFGEKLLGGIRAHRRSTKVDVHYYECALRYIWFDFQGDLLELEIQLPLRAGNSQKYLCIDELEEYGREVARQRAYAKKLRTAAEMDSGAREADETGRSLNRPTVIRSKPKGGKQARKEASAAANYFRGKG